MQDNSVFSVQYFGARRFIAYSNALANITRSLIGQRPKIATVFSGIYLKKPDVMGNFVFDWST